MKRDWIEIEWTIGFRSAIMSSFLHTLLSSLHFISCDTNECVLFMEVMLGNLFLSPIRSLIKMKINDLLISIYFQNTMSPYLIATIHWTFCSSKTLQSFSRLSNRELCCYFHCAFMSSMKLGKKNWRAIHFDLIRMWFDGLLTPTTSGERSHWRENM